MSFRGRNFRKAGSVGKEWMFLREKERQRENMHLHKLTDLLSFHEVAVGGTLPQTEYYREKLKRLHPMQMLSSNILLPLYEISLSYMTVRGNYRQAKKICFPGRVQRSRF